MALSNFHPQEPVSLNKAYGDFKDQLSLVTEKSVAQAKGLLASGLRTISYAPGLFADKLRYADVLKNSMNHLADDFERQSNLTKVTIGSTKLYQHVKILGAEVLKELTNKFSTIVPIISNKTTAPPPAAPASPYLTDAGKAVRVINHHLRTQFGDEYQLTPYEARFLESKYLELKNPKNITSDPDWVNRSFSDKDSGAKRAPFIRSTLETAFPMLLENIDRFEDPGDSFDPSKSAAASTLHKKQLEGRLEVLYLRLTNLKKPMDTHEIQKTLTLFDQAYERKVEHSSDPSTSLGLVMDRFLARDEVKEFLSTHPVSKEAFIKLQIAQVSDKAYNMADNFLNTLPQIEDNYRFFIDEYAQSRQAETRVKPDNAPGSEYLVQLESQNRVDLRDALKANELIHSKLDLLKQIRQNPVKALIEGISDKDGIKRGDSNKLYYGNARDDTKIIQTTVINPIEFPIKQNFLIIFDKICVRYIENKISDSSTKEQLIRQLKLLLSEFQSTGDLSKLNQFMTQLRTQYPPSSKG
ncbi:MAG: hypothetical protein LLG04_10735 [Parachlamydia sp.]|nr:hypothetical protein [Parachlamydia sp.]